MIVNELYIPENDKGLMKVKICSIVNEQTTCETSKTGEATEMNAHLQVWLCCDGLNRRRTERQTTAAKASQ